MSRSNSMMEAAAQLGSMHAEGAPAPGSQLAQAGSWLMSTATHVVLGVAAGAIAARVMRARHVHWSWAPAVFVLGLLARGSLSGAGSVVLTASLCAAAVGRRWQREDREAGRELAAIAAARRSPLELFQALAQRARQGAGMRAGGRTGGGELGLGRDERGRLVTIPLGAVEGRHALVVGATGSGKTTTQSWIVAGAVERGLGAIVLDPKGDGGLRRALREAAHSAGRPFLEWSPDGGSVYNPYARGSETEIADRVLAGERFTEPHYLRQAQRYLGHAVRALRAARREVSLSSIVEVLDPARLEVLLRALPESDAEATYAYLDALTARQQSDLAGVRDRLAILAESDVGRWLDPATPAAPQLELLGAARRRAVVYFSLEADVRPLLAEMLAAAIVQDLLGTVAALQAEPVATLVVIDEFSAVGAEQVVRLFARARSAGFSLLLGTQELSDLRLPGRARLLEQIMGNLSLLLAHRQVVPASAELVADLAGSRSGWRVSRHSDGRSTRTPTREGVLEAEEIMSLPRGWAAVIGLEGDRRVRIARMLSRPTVAGGRRGHGRRAL